MIKTNLIEGWTYGRSLVDTYAQIRKAIPDPDEAREAMRWYLYNLRDRMRRKFRVI